MLSLFIILLTLSACSGGGEGDEEQAPEETPTAENQVPVAVDQAFSVNQEGVLIIQTSGIDLDGDRLTLNIVENPSNGSIFVSSNQISYRPNNGFSGEDQIKFRFSDGKDFSNVGTLIITVLEVFVNSPPILISPSFSVQEDIQTPLQLQVIDIDGDDITFTILTPPQHGQLIGVLPITEYLSDLNFNGTDSFEVRISDGTESIDATVSIDIFAINDPPVFTSTSFSVQEDTQTLVNVLAQDIEGNQLTYEIISNPTEGVLIGEIPNLEYLPNSNIVDVDSFRVRVSDGLNQVEEDISITITQVNDKPEATVFSLTINEDEETVIPLSGTDVENDPLTFEISTMPNNAQINFTNNEWVLTPDPDFFGQVSLGYKAFDGELTSDEVVITIQIEPLNDSPVGGDVVANTEKNQQIIFSLPIQDVDSSSLSIEILESTRGGVVVQGNQITYTPENNFLGYDGFSYLVKDNLNAESEVSYVDLTVVDDVAGRRWNDISLPITIKIPRSIDTGLLVALFNVQEKWNDALGSQIIIMEQDVDNQEYDDLFESLDDFVYTVIFQYNSWFPGESTTLAVTTSQTVGGSFIVNVDILFNFFGYPYSTLTPVPNASIDFESVLLHEMGHLLGLPHIEPTEDPASIMNPTFGFGEEKRDLSIYDYQSMRKKYSLQPLTVLPVGTNMNYMGMEVENHSFRCKHIEEDL